MKYRRSKRIANKKKHETEVSPPPTRFKLRNLVIYFINSLLQVAILNTVLFIQFINEVNKKKQ